MPIWYPTLSPTFEFNYYETLVATLIAAILLGCVTITRAFLLLNKDIYYA